MASVRTVGLLLVPLALLAGAAGLQYERERRFPVRSVDDESLYLTSGDTLRRLTVGYNAVAADLYWIRAVQYYGDVRLRLASAQAGHAPTPERSPGGSPEDPRAAAPDYEALYPLLDITTSLDPRFNIAYRFGSIFLAESYPGGAGRPDLALALLEKGIARQPDKWEYMQDIGFVHYWWRHDYRAAAEWFERASHVPGAPWFLKSLAATTLAEGGDRRSSRTMWEALRESADNDWMKKDAERRLMQLDAMDFIPQVQDAVDRYTKAAGHPPTDWAPLIQQRVIPGLPADPTRTPYELDASGHVVLSPRSPLFPLPDEPQRLTAPAS